MDIGKIETRIRRAAFFCDGTHLKNRDGKEEKKKHSQHIKIK